MLRRTVRIIVAIGVLAGSAVPVATLWVIYLWPRLQFVEVADKYVGRPKVAHAWGLRAFETNRMSIPLFNADYHGNSLWFFSGPDGLPDLSNLVLNDLHVSVIFDQHGHDNLIQNIDAERPTITKVFGFHAFAFGMNDAKTYVTSR